MFKVSMCVMVKLVNKFQGISLCNKASHRLRLSSFDSRLASRYAKSCFKSSHVM